MKKQVELLRDPEHLKELAEIDKKTRNQKPRGRPIKNQSNSQPEEAGWMAPKFDPWNNTQISRTQESRNLSDDEDSEYFTNSNAEPSFETRNGQTATPTSAGRFRGKAAFQLLEFDTEKMG
jgi:hypothetical protein